MKKLFATTLAIVVFAIVAAVQVVAQTGFAYQAVIRDSEGNLITQGEVGLQFSLMNAGKTYYVEAKKATPDQYGNISVIIGDGKNKVSGSFDDVPWNTLDITLKVEVDVKGGTNYKLLGETKINPAPYAIYASKGGGAATVGGATKDGATLFEVNDRNGNPVFAVTDNGIVVYVDDTDNSDKARRSGFLIVGREDAKGESEKEYFSVTADGTQIHVDGDDSKVRRSGFYITGRESKGGQEDYLTVDGKGTTVYVDANGEDKVRRSGFYITGRDADKSADNNMFAVDGGQTSVYVDDLSNGKVRRSGFLIVGRDSKDGNGIVDITGNRTNLTTTTLSIANAGVNEEDAPVSAFQITEENITMNSDMAMEGGVRPALSDEKIEEMEEYSIWLSDSETDDEPDGYDYANSWGDFEFYNQSGYSWLGAFHDDLVVPLTSRYSFLMLNDEGKETAIAEDAVVVVSYDYGRIYVWPLAALDNFSVSFAMTNYYPTSAFSGSAEEYARFKVTLNSKAAYAGCQFSLGGQQVYTTKVETSQGTFNNVEAGGSYNNEYQVVFGETVTLAVTKVPDGQVFDSWRCNGRRYTDSVLHLPITQMSTYIYPVFKDISPVLWVDVNAADGGLGTKDEPYNTIAAALGRIIEENDNTLRGFRINVINSENVTNSEMDVINIGESLNDHAKHITIDFVGKGDFDRRISGITDLANIPVIVRNAEVYIDESTPVEGNAVLLSGKRLTLDGCLVHGSDGYQKKRGLYVEKGELVMIGGTVNNCKSENGNGGGAYVADGAILTLKNEAALESNTAQKGFGVYLCGGATLNVSNSYTNGNVKKDGDDVYAAGNCNFNVSGGSDIGKVGLGEGAFVSVTFDDERVEMSTIEFSNIADRDSKVVEIKSKVDERLEHRLPYFFEITDQALLDKDYSKYLKFEGNIGKPFITKRIYSTGIISLNVSGQIDVYYTYYRGEDDEEYLRLRYNWEESDYECHNYWLVGGKVYCDTIYASNGYAQGFAIGSGADLDEYYSGGFSWPDEWDDYSFDRTDDFKNLLTVNTAELSLDEDGNIIDNENKIIAFLNKGIIASCTSDDLFQNILPGFKSLIQRSLCIEGRAGYSLNGAGILQWAQGSTYFGDAVNDEIKTENDGFPNYSLDDIEERFDKLRNGYDVTIIALGGTVTYGQDNRYNGIVHLENVEYDTKLTLTAQQGENEFIGWSDGVKETTREFRIRGDVEIMPIFKQTEFTVSAGGPYKSFDLINKVIEKCGAADDVVINVNGTVKGSQTLSGNIHVHSITIQGNDDDIPDVLNGNQLGRVLTINTTSPVTIKNLTITGGKANVNDNDVNDENDENNFGGGIMMTEGTIVTLADGAVVGKAGVSKVATDNNYANFAGLRGGGIYNQGGTLTLESGSMVSYNYVKIYSIYYSTSTTGGAGIYSRGGEVIIEDGAEVMYNYSNSRGGGIHLDAGAKLTSSGKIDNNEADFYGGGVMFATYDGSNNDTINLYKSTTFTMEGGSVSNDKTTKGDLQDWGASGGGIFIDGGGTATIKAGLINGNSAPYNGGAIRIARGTLDLQGGTMEGNDLSWHEVNYCQGGAIGMNTSNCTFKISGNVYIPCTGIRKNDIYLDNGEFITIAGPLSNANVATITMENYDYEGQVLELAKIDNDGTPISTTTLMAEYGKFALTNNAYTIGFDGYIKEKITYGDKGYVKYKINSAESYKTLFDTLNFYKTNTENLYISVESTEKNLTLNDFKPYDPGDEISFKGVFDGNGHTLIINSVNKDKFMVICWRNEGIIQNVKVTVESSVTCGLSDAQYPAGFSGGICHANMNGGIIRNCWSNVSAEVKFVNPIGGICTHNYGVIENCLNTGDITGTYGAGNQAGEYGVVGGICGSNYGEIKNCVNYGTISMQTSYNSSSGLNGIPGAICGALYDNTSSCDRCFWLKDCVVNNNGTNNMVYNDPRVRYGSATLCGFFEIEETVEVVQGGEMTTLVGTITAGSVENCGGTENQDYRFTTINYGLNNYVGDDNAILKRWVVDMEAGYPSVLDFGN